MDDLISRQAAIDEWKNDFKGYINALNMPKDDYDGIMEYIDELPSAQPDIRLFGEYMILPDIPTPDEKQEIADELLKKLLNDLKMSGVVKFVWNLDGEIKTVGVKFGAVMPESYKEKP